MSAAAVAQENQGPDFEKRHVHQVYDEIASHFSETRFKPWPVVDEFLRSLPAGAVGLDVGCGNGKYLTVRRDIFIVASDRSHELLKFASQHQPHAAVVADTLNLPHQDNTFDFAICIAVIHHLSTPERRREAVRSILGTLRAPLGFNPDSTLRNPMTDNKSSHEAASVNGSSRYYASGRALIFVWALEQKNSRRGWDAGMEQDVMVPWVLKVGHDRDRKDLRGCDSSSGSGSGAGSSPSSLSSATASAANTATTSITAPATNSGQRAEDGTSGAEPPPDRLEREARIFHRYYHLYRAGELEDDIVAAGGKVVRKGYDRDNWWVICEPLAQDG